MANHTRELLLMIGESGTGKSTYAKQYVIDHPEYVRLNRDELRIELANDPTAPKGRGFEQFVAKVQAARANEALKSDKSVLIDDTNLNPNTRAKWENFARHRAAFRIYRMTTPLDVCIERDSKRVGKARVGRPVIERQFLVSGRLPIDRERPIVLVDLDGSLANCDGVRSPYEEHKVKLDKPYPVVAEWVRNLYIDHTVIIVSGRHSTCGDASVEWLNENNIPFHHIFMRHGWSNEHDTIIKKQILDELLTMVPKEKIVMVLDDRPRVVQTWKENGLFCIPLRGVTTHSPSCPDIGVVQKASCLHCGAIGDF